MFYIYEWYVKDTNEIFYVGKGTGKRYLNTKNRNEIFKSYLENNCCESRIIEKFSSEEKAFEREHQRICELKKQGFCKANLDDGGTGGVNFIWTDEMRNYKSKYNPMKSEEQRQRMKNENPMKNKDYAKKNGVKHMRAVIIKGMYFESGKSAGEYFKRHPEQIRTWCKRGYDSDKEPCRYADEEQKEFDLKITNSKKVIVDGIVYDSVKKAAEEYGVWPETIIRAIKNNKPFKGHVCEYDNQHPSQGKSDNSTLEGSTTNR